MFCIPDKLLIERLLLIRLRQDLFWDWNNKPYFYHFILMKLIVFGDFFISFMFRWIFINIVPISVFRRFNSRAYNVMLRLLYEVFEKFLVRDIYKVGRE